MKLDIGCGEIKRGDIGLDFRRTKYVNIIADARYLPFKDQAFDHVSSSEVIEHFSHRELYNLVTEWARVLKNNGVFEVECPDLRARALIFFFKPNWQNIENIYGAQDYPGNYHKSGFSFKLLKSVLESCGIYNVKRVIDGYKGVPFIPNCLHVKATKAGLQ
jgi:predicted SAM-dependent methyltransferase